MNNQDRKIIEKLEDQFYQMASQAMSQGEDIEKEYIESMKDLQKICYYMEVRCAMKEAEEYEDEEYVDDSDYQKRSYNNRYYNGSNMYGRGNMNSYARGGGYSRTSGRRNNSYMMNNGRSGRRYYDNEAEKENSVNDLRQMLQMEQDPEKRSMLEGIMRVLENDK